MCFYVCICVCVCLCWCLSIFLKCVCKLMHQISGIVYDYLEDFSCLWVCLCDPIDFSFSNWVISIIFWSVCGYQYQQLGIFMWISIFCGCVLALFIFKFFIWKQIWCGRICDWVWKSWLGKDSSGCHIDSPAVLVKLSWINWLSGWS